MSPEVNGGVALPCIFLNFTNFDNIYIIKGIKLTNLKCLLGEFLHMYILK